MELLYHIGGRHTAKWEDDSETSLHFLAGARIDFVDELIGTRFKIAESDRQLRLQHELFHLKLYWGRWT